MTDDEIMCQLSQAVRDDDVFAAEQMVTAGQQQHPEWNWPFMATVLWIQRDQIQEEPPRASGLAAVAALADRWWSRVRTGLALAPVPGTLHLNADWPVACLLGCHLAAVRVKGTSRPFGMAYGPP